VPASEASPVTPEVQYAMTDPRFSGTETAIGYGLTSPGMTPSGIRHVKENIPVTCIPDSTLAPCGPVSQSGIAENEFEAGDGPCDGDSGSGSFEQNSFNERMPIAFGVLSRGGASCMGSTYTRFDKWHDLIVATASTAASMGHYTAPAWTAPGPLSDDAGVADAAADGCADGGPCASAPSSPSEGRCSMGESNKPVPVRGAAGIALTAGAVLWRRRRGRSPLGQA
jgi:hypothetical protein